MTASFSAVFALPYFNFLALITKNAATTVEEKEDPDQLTLNVSNIEIELLRTLTPVDFTNLFDAYPQDTVTLSLVTSSDRAIIDSTNVPLTQQKLDILKDPYYNGIKFSIEISLNKQNAVDLWGLKQPGCQIFLYFNLENNKEVAGQ